MEVIVGRTHTIWFWECFSCMSRLWEMKKLKAGAKPSIYGRKQDSSVCAASLQAAVCLITTTFQGPFVRRNLLAAKPSSSASSPTGFSSLVEFA